MESKSIQVKLAPAKYHQLFEMKKNGYIRSMADFCAQAIINQLDEAYEKFLTHKNNQDEVLTC